MQKKLISWLIGLWYDNDKYSPPMWLVNLYLSQHRTPEQLEEFHKKTMELLRKLQEEA